MSSQMLSITFFLIMDEQVAKLGDPLASHAELRCASTAIADCQNEDPVSFTARTFRAVRGVADGALQQRAAQQLAGDRQLAQELLACSKGSRPIIHTNESTGVRHSQLQIRPSLRFSAKAAIQTASMTFPILRRKVGRMQNEVWRRTRRLVA